MAKLTLSGIISSLTPNERDVSGSVGTLDVVAADRLRRAFNDCSLVSDSSVYADGGIYIRTPNGNVLQDVVSLAQIANVICAAVNGDKPKRLPVDVQVSAEYQYDDYGWLLYTNYRHTDAELLKSMTVQGGGVFEVATYQDAGYNILISAYGSLSQGLIEKNAKRYIETFYGVGKNKPVVTVRESYGRDINFDVSREVTKLDKLQRKLLLIDGLGSVGVRQFTIGLAVANDLFDREVIEKEAKAVITKHLKKYSVV